MGRGWLMNSDRKDEIGEDSQADAELDEAIDNE